MNLKNVAVTVVLVVSVLLSACVAATPAPTPTSVPPTATLEPTKPPVSSGPDKVKVAYVAIMNFAPLYVAVERGYMKEQNIEVEMQKVASGSEAMAFLAKGDLDAGGVGIQAATFNAFNKGFELRIVGSAALQPQKDGPTVILVRKDLQDSGAVKTVADLKGKKVAMAGGPGTTGAYFVAKALKEAGLTVKDIEVVNIANPDMALAFENSSVDAALVGPPYSNQIISGGKGVLLAQDMVITISIRKILQPISNM
jgi:NitT/TauT family transport system substrate-binding protein